MKNKLNNKGFAVSTVVYAILILLVIFMFTILLLYRNAYRNQKDFNDEVKNELNDYLIDEFTPEDKNAPSCTLTQVKKSEDTYELIIESDNVDLDYENGAFMFEGGSYSNKNTTLKRKRDCTAGTCTYKAFVRDKAGNPSAACETTVKFDVTPPTCELTYDGSKLTIVKTSSADEVTTYSFDGTTFNNITTKPTTVAGSYTGYIKDVSDNVGQCSITLVNRTATLNVSNSCISSPSNGSKINCVTTNGGSCSIIAPSFTKDTSNWVCYLSGTFGWATSSSGSIEYKAGASISLSSNINLYATTKTSSSSGGSSGGDDDDCSPGISDIKDCDDNGVCTCYDPCTGETHICG